MSYIHQHVDDALIIPKDGAYVVAQCIDRDDNDNWLWSIGGGSFASVAAARIRSQPAAASRKNGLDRRGRRRFSCVSIVGAQS
jgi:hypothetical protein